MKTCFLPAMMACLAMAACSVRVQTRGDDASSSVYRSDASGYPRVQDFRVHRLSGSKVQLNWHATAADTSTGFEVMRKLGKDGLFVSVGFVKARQGSQGLADYALTDVNAFGDSSYYSLLQVDERGTKYFTRAMGVEGAAR